MAKFYGVARDSAGNALAAPVVKVFLAGSATPAALFGNAALTLPLGNPFEGNADGSYTFFVAPGSYKLRVEKPGFTPFELDDLTIGAAADHGQLVGLGDDDHPHYVHLTVPRSVSAAHTFSNGLFVNDTATGHQARAWCDTATGYALFGATTFSGLKLVTANTERLRIEASGNVSIGGGTPTAKLQVNGAGALALFSGSTTESQVQMASGGMTWALRLAGSTPSLTVLDAINGTEPLAIRPAAPSNAVVIEPAGVSLFGSGSYGGGSRVLFLGNRTTAPTSNPAGGVLLYAEGGAAKARGASGTVTTFAPAEPHCPTCGRDFVLEWRNEETGHLSVCMWCLTEALGGAGAFERRESK